MKQRISRISKPNKLRLNGKPAASSMAGFSLVELLVVVSIIGLLASIFLVASVHARENAQDNVLINNTKELSQALELYYQDNGTYPATVMTDSAPCQAWYDEWGSGSAPAEIHCLLGRMTPGPGYYSATNVNALAAALKPYLSALPKELTNADGIPQNLTLVIFDSTFVNNGQTLGDLQSGACLLPGPNTFYLWGFLNNRQTQLNLDGINSHGYFILSDMPRC